MAEQTAEQKAAEQAALDADASKTEDKGMQDELDDLFNLDEDLGEKKEEKVEEVVEEIAEETDKPKEEVAEKVEEEEPKKKEGSSSTDMEGQSEAQGSEQLEEKQEQQGTEDWKAKYEELLNQFKDDSEGGIVGYKQTKEEKAAKAEEPEVEKVDIKLEGFQAFKSQEEFESTFTKFEDYNKHMQTMIQLAVNKGAEEALRALPRVATNLVNNQIVVQSAMNKFYTDNPEFAGMRKYVSQVGALVEAQHPELAGTEHIDKLLGEVEKEVRKRLKLDKRVTEVIKTTGAKVGTRGLAGRNSSKPAPLPKKLSGQAAEVAELFDFDK